MASVRALGPERGSDLGGAIMRRLGPHLPWHKIAVANVGAVFPGRIDEIVGGCWENFGRTAVEYAHLHAFAPDTPGGPERMDIVGIEHLKTLRDDGKPGLMFGAHLANWELPALVANYCGLDAMFVYRPPDWGAVGRAIQQERESAGGRYLPSSPGSARAIKQVLDRGGHLGMTVDQHFHRGVVQTFLGRPALVNPTLAILARLYDCPVVGIRAVRLPGVRFRLEVTPPLQLPRDASGKIEVQGAMEKMTGVVEQWVLEYPTQWKWMHPRWRLEAALLATGGWPDRLPRRGRPTAPPSRTGKGISVL